MGAVLEGLLAEVERIRPILENHSEIAEVERRLADAVYDAMIDARLFRTLAPKAFGGLELHPVDHCRVIEAVARIDSAAGWILNQTTVAAGFVPWMDQQGAEEVYANGPDVIFSGGFFPPGPSVRVEGGWRVTCRSAFASGCDRAQWFMVPVLEVDDETSKFDPRTEDPPTIGAFVPRDEVDLIDTWHTVGMRGTFSADVSADDVFVPDHRIAFLESPHARPPAFSGPLFGLWPWTSTSGETAVSLGVARAAIDKLIELVTRKTPSYGRIQLRDREMAQHHAAKATALVDASRAYLDHSISEAYTEVERDGHYCEATKIRCQLAACFGAEACAQAVDLVYQASGSTAIRIEHGIERHHRDIHVLTQHAYKGYSRYEDVGKMLFGLPPTFWALRL
jgi:alkylation response protein AidB-like acyl-CoA dehydrogenase